MTDQEVAWFIATNRWKFAKTMAYIPHEYNVREWHDDDTDFVRFVMHIRLSGYDQNFYSKVYRYLDFGPYQYWTMGDPIDQTVIINRALRK